MTSKKQTTEPGAVLDWEAIAIPQDLAHVRGHALFDIAACVVFGDEAGLQAHRDNEAWNRRALQLHLAAQDAKQRGIEAQRQWLEAYQAGDMDRCLMAAASHRIAKDDEADAAFRPHGAAAISEKARRALDDSMKTRQWERAALAARLIPRVEFAILVGQDLPATLPYDLGHLHGVAKPISDLKARLADAVRALGDAGESDHRKKEAERFRKEAVDVLARFGIPLQSEEAS